MNVSHDIDRQPATVDGTMVTCGACGRSYHVDGDRPAPECTRNEGHPCYPERYPGSTVRVEVGEKPIERVNGISYGKPLAVSEPVVFTNLKPGEYLRTERTEPVAPVSAVDTVLQATEWQSMRDLARVAVRSGVLPEWITTEEKAQTVIAIGRELGVGPMTSLRLISLTKDNKIIMEAHLIRALVLRRIPGARMDVVVLTAEVCRITCSRPNHETRSFEWTVQDSKRAGLSEKNNHQCYPKQMNLARCTTLANAAYFSDADCGIYTPEDFAGFAESESDRKDRVEAARASASKAVELAAESGAIDPKVADQLRKLVATSQDDRKLATVEKKATDKVATLERDMAVAKAAEEGREDGRKAAAVTT